LSSVSLTVDSTELHRGDTAAIHINAAAIDGATADLTGAQIEIISSQPVVVAAESSKLLALDPGSAEVHVRVTLNGQTVQSAPVAIRVTSTYESIASLIDNYEASGQLQHPLAMQLRDSLDEAEHHRTAGRLDQEAHYLNKALEHLSKKAADATEAARKALEADIAAMLAI
jgi:hypothetical protein